MSENRYSCNGLPAQGGCRETVCIDTNRVLDSCRDRDCFENARVYLSDFGTDILNRTGAIRVKCAEILWTNIAMDPVQFNCGFYSITVRFFVKVVCEACVGCGHSQEVEGLCILEKRVVLFGGDSSSKIYQSTGAGSFCTDGNANIGSPNLPTAVVEVVAPVLLGTKIVEKECECSCCCCCNHDDLPEAVVNGLEGSPVFEGREGSRYLTVSLGIFSVVRIVRPSQLLVQASEYTVPEKQCMPVEDDNPCRVFRSIPFPVSEFSSQRCPDTIQSGNCGCNNERSTPCQKG